MISARSSVLIVATSGNSTGSPFSGNQPASRSATGSGAMVKATMPSPIAARFLPQRRTARGAIAKPITALTKTSATQMKRCVSSNCQK